MVWRGWVSWQSARLTSVHVLVHVGDGGRGRRWMSEEEAYNEAKMNVRTRGHLRHEGRQRFKCCKLCHTKGSNMSEISDREKQLINSQATTNLDIHCPFIPQDDHINIFSFFYSLYCEVHWSRCPKRKDTTQVLSIIPVIYRIFPKISAVNRKFDTKSLSQLCSNAQFVIWPQRTLYVMTDGRCQAYGLEGNVTVKCVDIPGGSAVMTNTCNCYIR